MRPSALVSGSMVSDIDDVPDPSAAESVSATARLGTSGQQVTEPSLSVCQDGPPPPLPQAARRHPDASWWFKLDRAKHHLHELQGAVAPYEALRKHEVRKGYEELTGHWVYTGHVAGKPSAWWSLIVGDALVNARAALDHMAWALNRPHARNRDIYFPILDEDPWVPMPSPKQRSRAKWFEHHTGNMQLGAVDIVKRSQPCWTSDPNTHVLITLRDLNNADKHEKLLVTVNAIPKGRFLYSDDVGRAQDKTLRPVTSGAVLRDGTRLDALQFETEMEFWASVKTAFGKTPDRVFDRETFEAICGFIEPSYISLTHTSTSNSSAFDRV